MMKFLWYSVNQEQMHATEAQWIQKSETHTVVEKVGRGFWEETSGCSEWQKASSHIMNKWDLDGLSHLLHRGLREESVFPCIGLD